MASAEGACAITRGFRGERAIAFLALYFQPLPFADLSLSGKIMVIVLLIVCLGAHEAAHAWTALRCGDTTGRDLGRITLNPIPHVDPMMTLIVPAVTVLTMGFLFGGAKPVPVNFYNLRRPYRDMALVAMAGPLSNFLCAAVLYLGLHVALLTGYAEDGKLLPHVLYWAIFWNLLLAAFNLLPIPPLDGSRVMAWILPGPLRAAYQSLERFGLLLVIGLFFLAPNLIWPPVWRTIEAMMVAIEWAVTLGGLW